MNVIKNVKDDCPLCREESNINRVLGETGFYTSLIDAPKETYILCVEVVTPFVNDMMPIIVQDKTGHLALDFSKQMKYWEKEMKVGERYILVSVQLYKARLYMANGSIIKPTTLPLTDVNPNKEPTTEKFKRQIKRYMTRMKQQYLRSFPDYYYYDS